MSINQSILPNLAVVSLTIAICILSGGGCRSPRSYLAKRSPQLSQPLDRRADERQGVCHQYSTATSAAGTAPLASTPKVSLISWQEEEKEDVQISQLAEKLNDDSSQLDKVDDLRSQSAPVLVTDSTLNSDVPMTVDACVAIALAGHPKIAAARSRVQAARNRVPQARAIEDPMLENMFFPITNNALQTAGGRMQNTIGISQRVPWPEKLNARAAVACQEVHIAQAEVDSIEREITEAVRLAYYEVWFAQRGTEILIENQKLVADLIRVAEARYKAGGSQQDVLNAEIERERLSQQLLELASAGAAAEAELAAYLQQPQSFALQTEDSLALNELPARLDALVALAEQFNPELRGLGFQIQRDLQKQRLANLQRYPDFQVGTQYGFMTGDEALSPAADGNDNISFSIGMTLPVYRNKINSGINEALANRAATSQLRESEHLAIEGRLRRALAEIDAINQQHTLYVERILPRAQQALEIALTEYAVGKTTFVQLTDNYTELLMYQLQIAKLESNLAAGLAQLERIVGSPLAR